MFKKLLYVTCLLIMVLVIVSCASTPPPPAQTVKPNYARKTSYPVLEVPDWLINLPAGENAIGFAWNNEYSQPNLDDVAREFAAVSISRNHSSFVVDKSAVIKYAEETEISSEGRDFKVVVSADTAYLNWADRNLKSQASISFNGYKATLFSTEPRQTENRLIRCSYANLPAWTSNREIFMMDGDLCIPGYATGASLIETWKSAQENALRKLAQYRLMNVISTLRSTDDWTKKMLILETVIQSPNAILSNTWIYQKKVDTFSTYGVFILLKVKAN